MKKIILSAMALLLGVISSFAQFTPAALPEDPYPTGLPQRIYDVAHTSNAGIRFNTYTDQFHVYSWSGEGTTSESGFAWRWTDNSNTIVYDQGNITYTGLMDVEVTILGNGYGTDARIIVAYYSTGSTLPMGHYFSIFDYSPGGLTYVSTTMLSTASSYGRISMDVLQNAGAFAVVWEEGSVLRMATCDYNGSFVDGPFDIPGTTGCHMPDIATARGLSGLGGSTLVVWLVYLNAMAQFEVVHWDINDPTHNFIVHDAITAPGSYVGVPMSSTISSRLNIDCPDIYSPFDWRNFCYAYENKNDIHCRVGKDGSPTATYVLTNGSIFSPAVNGHPNWFPTVCYDQTGNSIYCGWWSKYNLRFLAVEMTNTGTAVVPGYQEVNNTTCIHSPMSFSKNWFIVTAPPRLFCMYPEASDSTSPGTPGVDIYTKLNTWTATSFKQGSTAVNNVETTKAKHLAVWPNPFKDRVSLKVMNGDDADVYEVTMSDIQGRVIKSIKGTIADANGQFSVQNSFLPAGTYVVHVSGNGFTETVKIVKQ